MKVNDRVMLVSVESEVKGLYTDRLGKTGIVTRNYGDFVSIAWDDNYLGYNTPYTKNVKLLDDLFNKRCLKNNDLVTFKNGTTALLIGIDFYTVKDGFIMNTLESALTDYNEDLTTINRYQKNFDIVKISRLSNQPLYSKMYERKQERTLQQLKEELGYDFTLIEDEG